jgi:hypothetical protein
MNLTHGVHGALYRPDSTIGYQGTLFDACAVLQEATDKTAMRIISASLRAMFSESI